MGTSQRTILDELRDLDNEIASQSAGTGSVIVGHDTPLRVKRGTLLLEHSFTDAGLEELKKTDEQLATSNPRIAAQVAEAYRVEVRDSLLFEANPGPMIFASLDKAQYLFTAALNNLGSTKRQSPELESWLHAHLGAAWATRFWMEFSGVPNLAGAMGATPQDRANGAFTQADGEFKKAEAGRKGYSWSLRFHAFLYALRGGPGDFPTARTLLSQVPITGGPTVGNRPSTAEPSNTSPNDRSSAIGGVGMESSLQSSLAVLIGLESTPTSAPLGVQLGTDALKTDPNDDKAAYALGLNMWQLVQQADADVAAGKAAVAKANTDNDVVATATAAASTAHAEKEAKFLRPLLDAAIKTAKLRSRNAINRASVDLLSLELMRIDTVDPAQTEDRAEATARAIANAQAILQSFNEPGNRLDIEAQAFMKLDPVWKKRQNEVPYTILRDYYTGVSARMRNELQNP